MYWLYTEGFKYRQTLKGILSDMDSLDRLTLSEAKLLLSKVDNTRDLAILTLFLTTGITLHELTTLNIKALDWDKRLLTVGKRPRTIPLPDQTFDALAQWSKERLDSTTDHFFTTLKGKRTALSERSIDHIIRKYADKADLNHPINAHILRNTYAIEFLKTHSIEEAKAQLGISDTETVLRYKTVATNPSSNSNSDPTESDPTTSTSIPPIDTRSWIDKQLSRWLPSSVKKPIQLDQKTKADRLDLETILIGRESLIEDIKKRMTRGEPLLLKGPLGVGKTHLLHHIAQDLGTRCVQLDRPTPIKTVLKEIYTHIDTNCPETQLKRMTAKELLEKIEAANPLSLPILVMDNFDDLKPTDIDTIKSIMKRTTVLAACDDCPAKLKAILWSFQEVEVEPLEDEDVRTLTRHLSQGLTIEDLELLENRIVGLANGNPLAVVELVRQAGYNHVVTAQVVRDIYHEAGIKYRDWTSGLMVIWAGLIGFRFVALGTHSFEGYILAGFGTSIFVIVKYFFLRVRR